MFALPLLQVVSRQELRYAPGDALDDIRGSTRTFRRINQRRLQLYVGNQQRR